MSLAVEVSLYSGRVTMVRLYEKGMIADLVNKKAVDLLLTGVVILNRLRCHYKLETCM